MNNDFERLIGGALQDPEETLRQLDKIDAEESLANFIRIAWGGVEPNDYITNWHIDAICEHLDAMGSGQFPGQTLVINIPPGHQKSLTTCVFWPAWEWIRNPGLRTMFTSYRGDLALRDADRSRMLIKSAWYQKCWGDKFKIRSSSDQKTRFSNDKGGYRFSTSTNGIMGEGGDIVVFDDPHNVEQAESNDVREETVRKITMALPTRIRSKWGGAVVIMQRLHQGDYAGHLIEHEPNIVHLCLPARYEKSHPHPVKSPLGFKDPRTEDGELLFPGLFDEKRMSSLEHSLSTKGGSYAVAGQLQQRPAPREGGMFQRNWFEIIKRKPEGNGYCVRGWDLAGSEGSTAAYTAGVKLYAIKEPGESEYTFVIDNVQRKKGTPGKIEALFKEITKLDGSSVEQSIPQDPGQAGKSQVRTFKRKVPGYNVHSSTESGSKELRSEAVSSQAEIGNIKLVKGAWNKDFLDEIELFPRGTFKDQVDALSRAFHRLVTLTESDDDDMIGPITISKGK